MVVGYGGRGWDIGRSKDGKTVDMEVGGKEVGGGRGDG